MNDHTLPDHYEALGLSRNVSTDQVKAAFRFFMRRHHPDTNPDADPAVARAVTEAFHVLSDPDQRARYDADLRAADEAGAAPGSRVPRRDGSTGAQSFASDSPFGGPSQSGPSTPPQGTPAGGSVPGTQPLRTTTPQPTAGAHPPQWAPVDDVDAGPVRVEYPMRLDRYVTAAVFVAVVGLAFAAAEAAPVAPLLETPLNRGLAAAVAFLLLFLAGFALAPSSHPPRMGQEDDPAARRPLNLYVVGALTVAGVAAVPAVAPAGFGVWVHVIQAGVVGLGAGLLMTSTRRTQRRLNQVVRPRDLYTGDVFGGEAGGAAADVLERHLLPLFTLRAMRLVRAPDDASHAFTHAYVYGHRVAFVNAVTVPAGGFVRWHGSSLLLDVPGSPHPFEVLRGPFAKEVTSVERRLRKVKADVSTWVAVYSADGVAVVADGQVVGMPEVLDGSSLLAELGDWFVGDDAVTATVDQRVFVLAANALLG